MVLPLPFSPKDPQAQAYTKGLDSEALPALGITGRIPKRNRNLGSVSISKKRWVRIGICNSEGWPPPATLPHHRSQRHQIYSMNNHGGIILLLSQGGIEIPSSTSEKKTQGEWMPYSSPIFSLHFPPSPCLHLSPGMECLLFIFCLPLIPFPSSSSFFWVG